MIIKLEPYENGAHANQSNTPKVIPDGWVAVPRHLEAEAMSYLPFIELTVEDGVLTAVAQGTIPEPEPEPEPEPTAQDDTDAMLVDHEYRLTLLELGV